MNTAIIVVTHGESGLSLCESAQMIIGNQTNLASTSFILGENVETLKNKLLNITEKLNTQDGLLFLVDIFGGSPFNACCLVAANKSNYDVIAGVNIPMLINILLERESISSINDLANLAKTSAIEGIKQFKTDVIFSSSNNNEEDL